MAPRLFLVAPHFPNVPQAGLLLGCRWRPSPRATFGAYVVAFEDRAAAEVAARELDPRCPVRVLRAHQMPRAPSPGAAEARHLVQLPLRPARMRGRYRALQVLPIDLDDALAVLPLELNLGVVVARGPAPELRRPAAGGGGRREGRLLVQPADVYAPARDVEAFRWGLLTRAAGGASWWRAEEEEEEGNGDAPPR